MYSPSSEQKEALEFPLHQDTTSSLELKMKPCMLLHKDLKNYNSTGTLLENNTRRRDDSEDRLSSAVETEYSFSPKTMYK